MTVKSMAFSLPKVSYAHLRMERMPLTAAMPLLAMSTFSMTLVPPCAATNSATVIPLPILALGSEGELADAARSPLADEVAMFPLPYVWGQR